MEQEKKFILGIIGLGNMGSALLNGIVSSNLIQEERISIFDKDSEKVKKHSRIFKVRAANDLRELILDSKYILLAVKPQSINKR